MIVLSDHFPREINQELDREKIKVLKTTKVPVIIKINENEGVDGDGIHIDEAVGTYGKVDKSKGRISHFLWATLNMQEPDLSRFLLKNGKSGPGYGYNVVWES